ncbi:MAG: hypothetical protein M9928_22680 [Anaerolineae bacterium]|nr:hypothetical protein [Anaerolineae bacterium]MCO5191549.1 hypothetical protein [Anaerolineae bacterium]MCO5194858.1 hypothetical protein [Anaerolineae bacterium]MCO5207820.1 hypothetical protein [Anaerolineae bacterium]
MKSTTTSQFWKLYASLPVEIQRRADRAYKLWQLNPRAHSLFFKRVGKHTPVYSVRIGRNHRALGLLEGDTVVWFWIGSHDDYERLLSQM